MFKTDYSKVDFAQNENICPLCKKQVFENEKWGLTPDKKVVHKECFLYDNAWRPKSSIKVKINNYQSMGLWTEAGWLGDPYSFIPYEVEFKDSENPKYNQYWESRICDVAEDYGIIKPMQHRNIMVRANQMKNKNGFTKKGIYYSLLYHYKYNRGDASKSRGSIGIVPFVYQKASVFWRYKLWKEQKLIEETQKLQEKKVKLVVYQGSQYELSNSWKTVSREESVKKLFSDDEELNRAKDILAKMQKGEIK